jgi:RNA-directed DNA polymerase
VREADERHISGKRARAGARVLVSVTRDVQRTRKRVVHEAQRAVDRPWRRTFRGFSCTARQPNRRQVSAKALKTCKPELRRLPYRTRGGSRLGVVRDVRRDVPGWHAYCGDAAATSVFRALDAWIRRRLRCSLWKQWGRRRSRELVNRGVSRDLAWTTGKSAQGPWRLSRRPALTFALPGGDCDGLGGPRLSQRPRR